MKHPSFDTTPVIDNPEIIRCADCSNAQITSHPPTMPVGVRAYSDHFGHVIVRMSDGQEYGLDLTCAMRLLRDLRVAVDKAAGYD